ncbi:MAG: methylated-DNA--[protein]-cysteine S-methyltransferase [bacterium]|nr:methylated-DNA--[protein]-cysteine S-methyltransferase [bacterium]
MNDYQRIEQIIRYLDQHSDEQPDLEHLAKTVELSVFQLHRMFSRWAGITPKAFLKCLTLSHAKRLLLSGHSVLQTSLETGLSGPSRLHDLCVTLESASPGEIKSGGSGWQIIAGFVDTPLGNCLLATSPRGVCHISFPDCDEPAAAIAFIGKEWPQANIRWDPAAMNSLADLIFRRRLPGSDSSPLRALVHGSQFQVLVWRALLEIPAGHLVSYTDVANAIGHPTATRATGTAVGRNRLAVLIPCHRVIRQTGVIGNYRWGTSRKKALLAWETAGRSPESC